jgi:hypothetical protein
METFGRRAAGHRDLHSVRGRAPVPDDQFEDDENTNAMRACLD